MEQSTHSAAEASFLATAGARIAQRRLARNLTRPELAERAGVSLSTLKRIEGGCSAQVLSLLRVLAALDLPASVDALIPPAERSPLEELDSGRAARPRRRASKRRATPPRDHWTWGDGAGRCGSGVVCCVV